MRCAAGWWSRTSATSSRPENRYERRFGKLLEVYLPIDAPERPALAVRGLPALRGDHRQRAAPVARFAPALGAALLLLLAGAAAAGLVAGPPAAQRQREREALLHRAIDASDARAAPHRPATCTTAWCRTSPGSPTRSRPPATGSSARPAAAVGARCDAARRARASDRELRALLVEIYPPSLQRAGLGAALADLLAPLSARGLEVEVDIDSRPRRSPRDARSCSSAARRRRCATSPSTPTPRRCAVSVEPRRTARWCSPSRDDGRGFDPAAARRCRGHLGLRLLADLVDDAGGGSRSDSGAGRGTAA